MATVAYRGATRVYPGTPHSALDSLDLEINDGEFMVLVGPSDSGKSTPLRMLAGPEGVDGVEIHIGNRDVTRVEPAEQDIAMVSQNYARSTPQMTVGQNIGFHLETARKPKDFIAQEVAEAAELVDLTKYLDRKPVELAGGQLQQCDTPRHASDRQAHIFVAGFLGSQDLQLTARQASELTGPAVRVGIRPEAIGLTVKPGSVHFFDPGTGPRSSD